MLRRGGEIDGVRLLSPAMIRFAARNWIGDRPNMVWDPILSERGWSRFPDNIGLGLRVRGEGICPGPFGMLQSTGIFGHMGDGRTGSATDPDVRDRDVEGIRRSGSGGIGGSSNTKHK